ncbi:hypothetical protein O0I10_012189 [Lichtheimia ornata]|uniref:Barwin domain-containing protein n=1 Tax=Lichtheimia ornata TaxID=688661 RepID=A0AAD7XTA1_9FUNG|nr:uncharacterized protein O0I10_012189 [Lichtheimia ornata]KAJ8652178.1 hypothetical protein O0I10_012189 [Lichtheimia ornata]
MWLFFVSLCLFSLFYSAAVAETTYEGVATVMQFRPLKQISLAKRGHGNGTWYDGKDLLNAACYDRNGMPRWDATINDMIGAMAMNGFEDCYKCLRVTNKKHRDLSITIMVVDKCAACRVGKAIDLTPAAFQRLAPEGNLQLGVLDINWSPVSCDHLNHHPELPDE